MTRPERSSPVVGERVRDGLADELAVVLQRVERVLDGLVDGFLDGAANLLDLVDAAARLGSTFTSYVYVDAFKLRLEKRRTRGGTISDLVRVRDVDGGHVKATFVESRSLAELLDNLHHYSLKQKPEFITSCF